MPVVHVDRHGRTYHLRSSLTKTGKPRYWFSMKGEGEPAESIPDGFEVYEKPDARVYLRKIPRRLIAAEEVEVVERGLKRHAPGQSCLVDVEVEHLVVHHADREEAMRALWELSGRNAREVPSELLQYVPVLRFTLIDEDSRAFRAQRWCFRGSVDGWIDLWSAGGRGPLPDLVAKLAPHLGRESFFDLI